jgi:hypothetical protein
MLLGRKGKKFRGSLSICISPSNVRVPQQNVELARVFGRSQERYEREKNCWISFMTSSNTELHCLCLDVMRAAFSHTGSLVKEKLLRLRRPKDKDRDSEATESDFEHGSQLTSAAASAENVPGLLITNTIGDVVENFNLGLSPAGLGETPVAKDTVAMTRSSSEDLTPDGKRTFKGFKGILKPLR